MLGNLAREITTSFWNTTYFPNCLQAPPLSPFREEFCCNVIVRLLIQQHMLVAKQIKSEFTRFKDHCATLQPYNENTGQKIYGFSHGLPIASYIRNLIKHKHSVPVPVCKLRGCCQNVQNVWAKQAAFVVVFNVKRE